MIEVRNLTKRYGAKVAVDDISFSVDSGEILGFLGPNGAGKTTTMNIITGYLSSNEGSVTVGGSEILADPIKVKSQIGYLPELPPLYMDMTVREYLGFIFSLKKVKESKKSHIDEICQRVHIDDVKKRLIKNLSKGYRQRVGLAQALLGNPPVLILDEPTIGLDPKQIIEMRSLILELGRQHTIILSSHILSEIQAVCKRIIIIHHGSLVADGTPDDISQSLSGKQQLTIRVAGPQAEVQGALSALPGVQGVAYLGCLEDSSSDFALEPAGREDIRSDVFYMLAENRWPLLSLRSGALSLEEIFLRLTVGQTVLAEAKTDAEETAQTGAEETVQTDAEETVLAEADETVQASANETVLAEAAASTEEPAQADLKGGGA
ncbi:MAG: ABC transporter ATP-binding protein [Peptococcaceae bacterium]|nr:ABC transporter ATP-binding protein [Peptococcaceae bacterium]